MTAINFSKLEDFNKIIVKIINKNENAHSKDRLIDSIVLDSSVASTTKSKEFKFKEKLIQLSLILTLFIVSLISVIVLNVKKLNNFSTILNEYYNSNRSNESIFVFINTTDSYCNLVGDSKLSLISHPIAFFLVIVFMFLHWRRSCCLKFCFRRPAFPMIIPPFYKHNRLNSAIVYGIIATSIITMFLESVLKTSNSDLISNDIRDPSGFVSLIIKILDVLIAAIKYYPLLIAFYSDSFVIYLATSVYVIIDLINEIYSSGNNYFLK